jgi:tetratricopeptide (TPR) repeat protein
VPGAMIAPTLKSGDRLSRKLYPMTLLDLLVFPESGDLDAALEGVEIDAASADYLTKIAYVCTRKRLFAEAEELLARSFALAPGNPDAEFVLGLLKATKATGMHAKYAIVRDATSRALAAAETLYEGRLTEWELLEFALEKLSSACLAVGPEDLAIKASEKLASLFPAKARHHQNLGSAYANAGRPEAALQAMIKSHQLAPTPEKHAELADLQLLSTKIKAGAKRQARGRYPSTEEMTKDLRKTILEYLLNEIDPETFNFEITSETKVFTMGSCFAREISLRLLRKGIASLHLDVGEHINSTYANVAMLQWAEGKLDHSLNLKRLNDLLLPTTTPEQLLNRIKGASLFVYTLGVAPCFFDRENGGFVMPRASALNNHALAEVFEFRTTSVGENVANLRAIVEFVRRHNPAAKFVITLSPVPLKVTFERKSAVQADCLSKSTLRVAAEEVVREDPSNLLYWPSFEIVRWLGGHAGPFYGVDDGAAWHVSTAVVELITDLFIDQFATPPPPR